MRYRIVKDPDEFNRYPWIIQEKPLFGKWRFRIGFFRTREQAESFRRGQCFKDYKGPVYNCPYNPYI